MNNTNISDEDLKKLDNLKRRYKKQNESIKEKYDRTSVTLPKGAKERIKAQGETVNGFISRVVVSELERLEMAQRYKQERYIPDTDGDKDNTLPFK